MSVPRFWRFNRERYRLTGAQCANCGEQFLAARLVCPHCHSEIEQIARHVFPTLAVSEPSRADEQPSVSATVLIPSYNAAGTIRGTLFPLLAQDFDEPYEIIVVDSSSDETPRIITDEFPAVRLIHLDEQTDPGTARNLGIVQSKGEIIACLDANCTAPPDWLRRMVVAQRAGHLVVGGSVENGNPGKTLAWAGFLSEFREFIAVGESRLVRHVPTCNISYHHSIFTRFGGFPMSFHPQEDWLFHWRLGRQGVSIWFEPDIQMKYVHLAEWRPYLGHQRRIGHTTAQVLELTAEEGAFLARSPLLALLVAPFLIAVKFLRTIAHFVNWRPKVIWQHWIALPPLFLGLHAWAIGFVAGAWGNPLRVPMRESLEELAAQ